MPATNATGTLAAAAAATLGYTLTAATEIECCQGRTLVDGHMAKRHNCPHCRREAWQTTGTLVTTAPGAGFYFAAHRSSQLSRFLADQVAKRG